MTEQGDAQRERLSGFMDQLSAGLEAIDRDYGRFVDLVDSDPETFGGGHFVLYRPDNLARFTIEEHYTDTDWSDPDRLPTSWSWRNEDLTSHPSGGGLWAARDEGHVQAEDVEQLIGRAREWARSVRNQTLREASLESLTRENPAAQQHLPTRGL